MEDVSNSINICPANPIQILNLHEFFEDFDFCLSKDIFNINKKWILVLGPHEKDMTLLGIKQTNVIPK